MTSKRQFHLVFKSVVSGDLCGGNQTLTADNILTVLEKWIVPDIQKVRDCVLHKNLAKNYVHYGRSYIIIRVK